MTNMSLLMTPPASPAGDRRHSEHLRSLRRPEHAGSEPATAPIAVRRLNESDRERLARLAELDSAAIPGGELLGAEVDGTLVAVLSLGDGTLIADPFRRSTAAVELLELRARQLGAGGRRRRGLRLRLRLRGGAGARSRGSLPSSPPGAGGRLLQL